MAIKYIHIPNGHKIYQMDIIYAKDFKNK
jgi:hypothetical protein